MACQASPFWLPAPSYGEQTNDQNEPSGSRKAPWQLFITSLCCCRGKTKRRIGCTSPWKGTPRTTFRRGQNECFLVSGAHLPPTLSYGVPPPPSPSPPYRYIQSACSPHPPLTALGKTRRHGSNTRPYALQMWIDHFKVAPCPDLLEILIAMMLSTGQFFCILGLHLPTLFN